MISNIFVLIVVIMVRGEEPVCSKFHYESQTLEKMIRQELAVEKMKTEIEETRKQVSSALSELRAERESFTREIDSMKTVQEIEKQKMIKELGDIKGDMMTPYVFFHAHTVQNKRLVSGETFMFTNVVADVANAYSNQSGVFTPPYGGVYAFSVNLCIAAVNSYMHIKISSSEKVVFQTALVSSTGAYSGCYSLPALTVLKKGETVVVKMGATSISGKDVVWESSEAWNSFSGVLLRTIN